MQYLPIILSLIALMTSILGTVFAIKQRDTSSKQALRSQLNKLILELVEINGQSYQVDNTPIEKQDADFFLKRTYYAEKRSAITKQAVWIVNQIKSLVSDTEYNLIARALFGIDDNEQSEDFHKLAINNSLSENSKIYNTRSYADFLYLIGKSFEGAKKYETVILDDTTDNKKSTNGLTYQMRCKNEAQIGNYKSAIQDYEKALFYYNTMSNKGYADYWIRNLNIEIQKLIPQQEFDKINKSTTIDKNIFNQFLKREE